MISICGPGWAKFEYGNFVGRCSYLTDVPVDILEGCSKYLDNYSCSIPPIFFDEEGSSFSLVMGYHKSVIIAERETTEIYVIDMDYKPLIEQFIADIEAAGAWKWAAEFAIDIKDIEEMQSEISELLKTVKEKLRKTKKQWRKLQEERKNNNEQY